MLELELSDESLELFEAFGSGCWVSAFLFNSALVCEAVPAALEGDVDVVLAPFVV